MRKLVAIFFAVASLALTAAPLLAAEAVSTTTTAIESPAMATLTNVNTATAIELMKLPGIGKKSAAAIVDYRTEKGKFKTAKDLLKVKGIGKKTLEKVQTLIRFA